MSRDEILFLRSIFETLSRTSVSGCRIFFMFGWTLSKLRQQRELLSVWLHFVLKSYSIDAADRKKKKMRKLKLELHVSIVGMALMAIFWSLLDCVNCKLSRFITQYTVFNLDTMKILWASWKRHICRSQISHARNSFDVKTKDSRISITKLHPSITNLSPSNNKCYCFQSFTSFAFPSSYNISVTQTQREFSHHNSNANTSHPHKMLMMKIGKHIPRLFSGAHSHRSEHTKNIIMIMLMEAKATEEEKLHLWGFPDSPLHACSMDGKTRCLSAE